jgi:predicted ATP-dependent serine protease
MKICHNCTKPSKPGYGRCQKCLDLHSAQQEKYRKNNREKYNEREVERKKRNFAVGLCPRCGGPKDPDADEGYVECVNCRLKLTRRI